MGKHLLIIRSKDRWIYQAIKSGRKKFETRAATNKYRKIKVGETLTFVCGKDKLDKVVVRILSFKDIKTLVEKIGLNQIMPSISSIQEARKVWYSFPGYQEKIKRYGLLAFELG